MENFEKAGEKKIKFLKVALPKKLVLVQEKKEDIEKNSERNHEYSTKIGQRVIIKYKDGNKTKKELGVVIDEILGENEEQKFENSEREKNTNGKIKEDEKIQIVECIEINLPDKNPFLTQEMIKTSEKIADKYLAEIFEVLSLFSPPSFLKLEVRISEKIKNKSMSELEGIFSKERGRKIFEILRKRKKISLSQAVKTTSWEKVISLEEKGLIDIIPAKKEKSREEVESWFSKKMENTENSSQPNFQLTDEQKNALNKILGRYNENLGSGRWDEREEGEEEKKGEEGGKKEGEEVLRQKCEKFLIHGVTGSGKTEVYLRAIESLISEGGGAIYLLPEISLTTFLIERIKSRFPDAVVLHSGIGEKEREMNWWALRYGISRVAVGARSCVFAPVENLKIIIVDEEHDSSYNQSPENTRSEIFYDARYVAEIRTEISGGKVVFGSATPSVTLYFRAKAESSEENKKVVLIEMKKRVEGMSFPKTKVIDLREAEYDDFLSFPLSEELRAEIQKRIERKENIILLFTRRGWALSVICENCSFKFKCLQCDTSLTYHKKGLLCHWCGKEYGIPLNCPKCGSDKLGIIGFGTERIEDELKSMFKIPVFRMDSDVVKSEKHAKKILDEFKKTSPAILLGTQMVAKGFDFPKVSLVGVILADTEFLLPDFRADERAFQLFTQVVGRAGRKIKGKMMMKDNDEDIGQSERCEEDRKANENNKNQDINEKRKINGEEWENDDSQDLSMIQTFSPDYPVIKYAVEGEYEKFFEMEIKKREEFGLPPFREIVLISLQGGKEDVCWKVAYDISERIKSVGLHYEQPTKSARYFLAGKYNIKIPVYISGERDFRKLKKVIKKSVFFLKGVKIKVDVQPDTVL